MSKFNDEVNLLLSKSTVTMLNNSFSLYHDVVCFAFTPNYTIYGNFKNYELERPDATSNTFFTLWSGNLITSGTFTKEI